MPWTEIPSIFPDESLAFAWRGQAITGVRLPPWRADEFSTPYETLSAQWTNFAKALSVVDTHALATFLPLIDWAEATDFQRSVSLCLAETVGRGETITYGALAQRCGRPGAARAVGTVMRRNTFPLLIPCHRVVSTTGMGTFQGGCLGSVDRKRMLLQLEGLCEIDG